MQIHDENIAKLSYGLCRYIVATTLKGLKQNCAILVKITANIQVFEVTLVTVNFEFLYLRNLRNKLYTCLQCNVSILTSAEHSAFRSTINQHKNKIVDQKLPRQHFKPPCRNMFFQLPEAFLMFYSYVQTFRHSYSYLQTVVYSYSDLQISCMHLATYRSSYIPKATVRYSHIFIATYRSSYVLKTAVRYSHIFIATYISSYVLITTVRYSYLFLASYRFTYVLTATDRFSLFLQLPTNIRVFLQLPAYTYSYSLFLKLPVDTHT